MLPVIALVGRPNVGKSTLFNSLTRTRDALVADQPGLTRDRKYGIGLLGPRHYLVVDTGGLSTDEDGISALMCALHSGRTHQIRVHLAHQGHPLVSDALYGGKPALAMARQALHAAQLRFAHPATQRPLRFDCPAPVDFAQAWRHVEGGVARWRDG